MKLFPQLILTAASLTIGLASIGIQTASAAIVNYAFTVDSPTNKGKGFFSFDDSTFSNDSIPEALVQSLSFQFDGDSTIYTEKDAIAYPFFPVVLSTTYLTGKPTVGLSYSFYDKTNPAEPIVYEIVDNNFTILSGASSNTEIGFGTVTYSQIPEPATLGGTLLTFGLAFLGNKKSKFMKKSNL
ncbi:PEP-CTERM sorting domain-containing protein [Nostoc parmelioides]|uniref:PEP-CTERM sorting domain-containing protein n=1 Tax=Nostoc parmelioides FACHB-3921 TaxID=2692909 RepID=A0ABR8BAY2_9NOSO|nr:PEP-CTERM sorting domain-containing protein [Nostoc parmelioides]MBD2251105.1 PEP-CTERM sorting domain-containing protein [Nostoc parmelioides FACHB-3921]